jgi:hypothetical protein
VPPPARTKASRATAGALQAGGTQRAGRPVGTASSFLPSAATSSPPFLSARGDARRLEKVTVTSISSPATAWVTGSRTGRPAASERAWASSMSSPWLAAYGSYGGLGAVARAGGAAPASMSFVPQRHRIE